VRVNEIWHALANEAGSSAEHLGLGVTSLSRANYAQKAYYTQSFFALSVGLERACKLILVADHAVTKGVFPSNAQVRRYGHKLTDLMDAADKVAEGLQVSDEERMPRSGIHDAVIETLSDFASNVTRYYNLDLVTGAKRIQGREDPIAEWWRRVTKPVLRQHYPQRSEDLHFANALAIENMAGQYMLVRFFAEDGALIDSPGAAAMRTAETEFARRWERMYVLQFARFVGGVLGKLGYQGAGSEEIPYFSEFFGIFRNSDEYFRGRKTWSIHRS
jgi:hypothetical protein